MENLYDVAIIGSGPAGMAAGLYTSRARLSTVLFESLAYGGQVILTDRVENYPGSPDEKGIELAKKFYEQSLKFGVKFLNSEIIKLEETVIGGRKIFRLIDKESNPYQSLCVIVATGANWRRLDVPGAERFEGRGISYCATCDGPLYKNKEVVVVGGGNAAAEEALFLTKFVSKLTLVHRKGMLRATKVLQDELLKNSKVELRLDSVITGVNGDKLIESAEIKNNKTNVTEKIRCQGAFVFIGRDPNTGFLKGFLELDEHNHIITDEGMRTSGEGVFAAGDVRKKALRQIVTAASDGATAAYSAEEYIRKLKGQEYK